ncbi:unnamed protein product [Meganyctiphanes norvegica]|uniref:Caspase-8 n=1 Tax=Meganyctiphanes norvegica TaxID=48144 RepID=A0AAV2QIP4_MEGNR
MDARCVDKIPDIDIPKMLFLAIDPNKAAEIELHVPGIGGGSGDISPSEDNAISRLLQKYEEALKGKSINPVRRELQIRLLTLGAHQMNTSNNLSTLESNFSDASDQLTYTEEDILEFNEIFEMFGHTAPESLKISFGQVIASKKIPVGHPGLGKKSFFVYTENKVMLDICNNLTASDVLHMYDGLHHSKENETEEKLEDILELKMDEDAMKKVPGLKEVAFFYLILKMMRQNMLNRLYTHKLIFILNMVMESNKHLSKKYSYIEPLIVSLDKYPMTSRPPGLCIIFSMHDGRPGAEHDLNKVKALFEKTFMYDVFFKIDPSAQDIKFITSKLSSPRNKFYDSLVVFFMGHGSKSSLNVKNGTIHRRTDFIEPFTEVEWFHKKPKLFFIQACAVKQNRKRFPSTSNRLSGLAAETDALPLSRSSSEWSNRYSGHIDISIVNNFADTLISHATMWYQLSSRTAEGSLYVDTLVDQLREHGHRESIENVLRRVHYNVNTVSLLTYDKGEEVQWKQAPFFESSLQKAFVFPCNGTASSS